MPQTKRAKKSNPHAGHRERMRQRFDNSAPDTFADHELLELALYHAIPRGDTNALAHALIEEYGSLAGVLEADPSNVAATVEGAGENTARFLSMLHEIARRYTAEKTSGRSHYPVFDTPQKIINFIRPRYVGLTVERAYLLLFDNGMRLLDCFHVADGSLSGVLLSVRRMVERALTKHAAAAVLVHNHPGGLAVPSAEDVRVTKKLEIALSALEFPLIEHFIITDNDYAPVIAQYKDNGEDAKAASSLCEVLESRLCALKS